MSLIGYFKYILLQLKGFYVFRVRVGVLGNFTVIKRENVKIGRGCGINHRVFILAEHGVEIGENVVLSAGAMLIDSGLDVRGYANSAFPMHVGKKIVIEDGVWIGAGAIILPGVRIGKKSIVGAGSVVTKNVDPYTIVAGNPARMIRRVE